MNIPPFLENLLLSNEATFKVAPLGLSGQNFIPIPPGKTAVILEIGIEPFCNEVQYIAQLLAEGLQADLQNLTAYINRRMMFQLQIINDNYNSTFSFNNRFSLDTVITGENNAKTLNQKFDGWKEDVFIYTDRGIYFNIIYPYVDVEALPIGPGIVPIYSTPAADFSPNEQYLPPSPVTFYKSTTLDFVKVIYTNQNPNQYYAPVNRNQINPLANPLKEFFVIEADHLSNAYASVKQPVATGNDYNWFNLLQLPLINVKYALINKRASDYGLTPGTK